MRRKAFRGEIVQWAAFSREHRFCRGGRGSASIANDLKNAVANAFGCRLVRRRHQASQRILEAASLLSGAKQRGDQPKGGFSGGRMPCRWDKSRTGKWIKYQSRHSSEHGFDRKGGGSCQEPIACRKSGGGGTGTIRRQPQRGRRIRSDAPCALEIRPWTRCLSKAKLGQMRELHSKPPMLRGVEPRGVGGGDQQPGRIRGRP